MIGRGKAIERWPSDRWGNGRIGLNRRIAIGDRSKRLAIDRRMERSGCDAINRGVSHRSCDCDWAWAAISAQPLDLIGSTVKIGAGTLRVKSIASRFFVL